MSSLVQTLKSDFLKTMNRSSRQRFGGDLHLKLLLCTFHTDFSFFHLRIYFCGVRALRCHVSFGTRQFLFISHYSPWIITSYPPEPACWRKKSTPLHHQECPAPSLFETQQSPFTVESFLFSCRSSNFVLTNYSLSF